MAISYLGSVRKSKSAILICPWKKAVTWLWKTIRIFNGREVRIENSVTRVTVRHHEAVPSDAEQLSRVTEFSFEPNNHYRFFFFHELKAESGRL